MVEYLLRWLLWWFRFAVPEYLFRSAVCFDLRSCCVNVDYKQSVRNESAPRHLLLLAGNLGVSTRLFCRTRFAMLRNSFFHESLKTVLGPSTQYVQYQGEIMLFGAILSSRNFRGRVHYAGLSSSGGELGGVNSTFCKKNLAVPSRSELELCSFVIFVVISILRFFN